MKWTQNPWMVPRVVPEHRGPNLAIDESNTPSFRINRGADPILFVEHSIHHHGRYLHLSSQCSTCTPSGAGCTCAKDTCKCENCPNKAHAENCGCGSGGDCVCAKEGKSCTCTK
ncbi:hypothetical protein A0H81_10421 [Grifola frondosa]|uniref:Metallothionein n=1 Tax=Grifola frondosa TaxID=5627 RepID=A0A1C7LYD9_GRIFR|nr:hypothetical protein A0H81_10421 [Grifola frondosa]